MTLIVDDDNVCKECGAYFESSGYCVNGHAKIVEIPIEPKPLEDLTAEVAKAREHVAYLKSLAPGTEQRVHDSQEWKDLQQLVDTIRDAQSHLEETEAVAKIAVEIHNEKTKEKKGFGWQVKNFKTIKYPADKALEWAKSKPTKANLVKLNKSPFEKTARTLIESGMADDLDFVELGNEDRAQLTKELG